MSLDPRCFGSGVSLGEICGALQLEQPAVWCFKNQVGKGVQVLVTFFTSSCFHRGDHSHEPLRLPSKMCLLISLSSGLTALVREASWEPCSYSRSQRAFTFQTLFLPLP